MPRADDNFTLQFVSTKLFQDLLFKSFLSLLTRKYLEDLFPWIFNPKIYILPRSWLLSSMSHRSEICNLFQRCLLTAEDSIRCLRWDDLVSNPPATLPGDPEQPLIHRGVEEDEANLADTDKLMNFDGSLSLLDEMALGEGESLSTPSSPHSISSYSRRQINLPKGLKDLDYKILQSGIFIFPGSYALDHSLVGFLFTSSPLWRDQMISSSELARHFLYFSTLSRKRKKCVGLTLVADIRGSTSSTVNTILEALHLFHSNNEQGFRSIYILANQLDQTLIFGSPLYDAQGPLKIEVLQSPDVLQSYIGVDQLPSAFDGQLEYHHDSWLRFRRKLEPFVNDCQLVDQYLQDTLKQLTVYDRIPSTYDETSQFLWEHEQQMQSILDAPQLMLLQDGHSIIHQLQEEAPYLKSIESCKEELVSVKKMYKELQNSMKNLVKLAENRFHKLEQGLQLRGFESECNKLNVWISTEGKRILEKYNSCVDNLKSAKSLEEQFLKDYFSAMTYIDKGNDLVEEACMLAQSGISTDSATGYRDLVKGLKVHLKQFIKDLEATREKVEGTRKIYRTLDKAYNWALESMKFIVNMKTENCSSVEKLDNMIRSMELFMQDHPPISDELFKETLQQAKELQNEKLISQCQKTIARCEEAQCKLKSRKLALKRAKSQRQTKSLANSDSPCNCIVKSSVTDLDENYLLLPPSQSEKKTASWHAICASLPTSPKIQPRRASLPTKGEIVTQISPISNMSSQDMEEYQEQLFNDGYITEDLSHHVVTSLPKSLTLRPDPNDCDTSGNKDKLFSRLYSSKKSITRTVTVPVTLSHTVQNYKLTSSQTLPQVDTPGTLDSVPRTVALILQELISTERDYVQALKLIVDNYIPEITKEEVPHALRGKRSIIFGNIEKIYEFHNQYFLQELETCKHYPFQIAQIFLSHEEHFYLYALYNKNKPKSDHLMAEHGTEFFRIKQNELKDKMNLSSYLLRPVQRMGKYALLLKQMIKACPETETEYNDLKSAEEMVKFHLRHGNDLLAMDSLKECDVNLQEQGRLLRQNEFFVTQGRKKSMRHIFLFEELVLFSKTKKDRHGGPESYIYKYSFKTSDIGLTENFRDHTNKFEIWFRRRSLGENYILHAQDNDIKKSWVQDISRLLWRQAIKNRESRKTEMASMGMGSKPSFDLKADYNLNENLVTSGQFAARSRNSIAVSSVDHFRDGAKRPLSINSLSSTSSSSSGQSTSHGLLNSLNLAFENMILSSNANADSPHFNRRSMNSSNESGICTDIFPETEGCVAAAAAANAQTGSTSATTLPVNTRMLASSTNSSPCPYQQTNSEGTSITTTTSIQTPTQPTSTAANKHALSDQPSSIDTQVSSAITFPSSTTTTTKQADPARLWLDLSKTRQPTEFKLRLAPMHGLTNIANINAEESEL
ncbi:puratrophin-1-like isoform X2 [Octopus sinensis]|uniref:Puratrophin-1-like isoform X2 n=1 Tax=Octopus sinensis TaxID=2607531 RepID=A0A7E6EVY8_9MOLL|nr:puratrophin-1-like isoform X2 [Octopus sinensis]